jgi:hypothetical protein
MHALNCQGVSCGMEAVGTMVIFTHSVDMHVVSYTKGLDDRDNKGFM